MTGVQTCALPIYGRVSTILGVVAVACAMTNVVGGFIITDRMLNMFKRKTDDGKKELRKEGKSDVTTDATK